MPKRSTFVILGSAFGCLALLLCIGIALVAGSIYLFPRWSTFTLSRVDRIAYVDNDLNIQLVDAQGGQKVALTTDASESERRLYMYPTWSPDSQQIAFIGLTGSASQEAGLYTVSPTTGSHRVTVFKSTTQMPFYLYWSPDNQRIGFLAQSDTEMALMLGHADGKNEAQKLATGAPFYWAWSPDGKSMLLHIGGSRHDSAKARLELLHWQESNAAQSLARGPSDFEAPQYSPDGSMILYAGTADADNDALYVADAHDANARSVTKFSGRIAFAWSPDGKRIAWIITDADSGLPNLGSVYISDADGTHNRAITTEDALAFYWSPNSQQIAYLTVPEVNNQSCTFDCARAPGLAAPLRQAPTIHLRWSVVNLADNHAQTIANFVPTDEFVSVLPYFDQYARSITFWSPDSQKFVYTQSEQNASGSVWVADVAGAAKPRKIGDGTLAVWSWK